MSTTSKNPLWKQANPVDQLTVIRSCLQGFLSNVEDGTTTPEMFVLRVKPLLEQIAALEPYLSGKLPWEQS